MTRLTPLALKAWALPLIVLAIVLPGVGAFIVVGPALGMAVGALAATALAVIAARMPFDEPIEVATSADRRYHLLVVATTTIDHHAATLIAERVEAGYRSVGSREEDSVDVGSDQTGRSVAESWSGQISERGQQRSSSSSSNHDQYPVMVPNFCDD